MTPALATPYRRGARGPDAYDCWGLVLAVLGARPELARYTLEDRDAIDAHLCRELAAGAWRAAWPPAEGDLVLMGTRERLRHAGVATAAGILHTTPRTGVVIDSLGHLAQLYARLEAYRPWRA